MTAVPTLRRIGEALGTEVCGMNLADGTGQDTADWIKHALMAHPVLVFRYQNLDARDMARLGMQLGKIEKHAFEQYRHPEVPEVSYVTNRDADGKIDKYGVTRASDWHFDEPYKTRLPYCTILHALRVPREKGGTEFADMCAAYDTLPRDLRESVEGKRSVFRVRSVDNSRVVAEAVHPTVYTHPDSHRRLVLISPLHQAGFEGVGADDSMKLLNRIVGHATRGASYYYHQWQVGDVVIWDQVATIHRNAADSDPQEARVFLRTIVQRASEGR